MNLNWTTELKDIKETGFNINVNLYKLNPDYM